MKAETLLRDYYPYKTSELGKTGEFAGFLIQCITQCADSRTAHDSNATGLRCLKLKQLEI